MRVCAIAYLLVCISKNRIIYIYIYTHTYACVRVLVSYEDARCLSFRKKTATVHSPMTSVWQSDAHSLDRTILVLTFNTSSCVC